MPTSTEDLLVQFRETGDRGAFRSFFDRTVPAVLGVARSLGVPEDRHDDLVQDTYLAVLVRIAHFDASQTASAWVRGIARKKSLRARTEQRAVPTEGHDHACNEDPGEILAAAEVRRVVRESLARMHDQHRQVLDLYYLKSMSTTSIAKMLGRHPSTVRSQIMRALVELRRYLPPGVTVATLLVFDLDALPSATSLATRREPGSGETMELGARPKDIAARAGLVVTAVTLGLVALLLSAAGRGAEPTTPAPEPTVSYAAASLPELSKSAAPARTPIDGPASGPEAEQVRGNGQVVVRVVNRSDGLPVPHVALGLQCVTPGQPPHAKALIDGFYPGVTDEEGLVRFEGVPDGPFRVRYSNSNGSELYDSRVTTSVVVAVERVGIVRGVVRDAEGLPVPDAAIWCSEAGPGPYRPPFVAVRSGDDGTFLVAFVESDNKCLWAHTPGWRSSPQRVRFDQVLEPLQLVLVEAPRSVRGRVFMDTRPADDVLVALYPTERHGARPPVICRSKGGDYEFDTVLPASYLLVAQGHAGTWAWEPVDLTRDSALRLDLHLKTGTSVHGVLLSETGEPVVDRLVVGMPSRRFGRAAPHLLWRFGRTDEEGRFVIESLAPGPVKLQAIGPAGAIQAAGRREIALNESREWTLILKPHARMSENARAAAMDHWYRTTIWPPTGATNLHIGPTCTVHVAVDPSLFAGRQSLLIGLRPVSSNPDLDPQQKTVTAESSECDFDGVAPGDYVVFVIMTGNTEKAMTPLAVRAGQTTETLKLTRVRGTGRAGSTSPPRPATR